MEIILNFTYHSDLIKVPNNVGKNIRSIRKEFDKWLYDKSNDHGYWIYANGKKKAVSYDTQTFVEYLNKYHISDKDPQAYIAESNCKINSSDIIILYF